MKNEQDIRLWFLNYLKDNLGYIDEYIIVEKRINNCVIDILIVDPYSNNISYKALVEFKASDIDKERVLAQINKYKENLGNIKLPCYLVQDKNVYVLETNQWKLISIKDFPIYEKLT
jgi:hypothetical protein